MVEIWWRLVERACGEKARLAAANAGGTGLAPQLMADLTEMAREEGVYVSPPQPHYRMNTNVAVGGTGVTKLTPRLPKDIRRKDTAQQK